MLYATDDWALNNRGLAYLKLGDREKARQDFQAALKINPGFEPARRGLESASPNEAVEKSPPDRD